MPSPQQSQPAGFSLFPSPDASKPPPTSRSLQAHRGRRSESQERRPQTPQVQRVATPDQHPQAPGHPSYSPPVQFEPAPAATPSNWPLSSDTPHSETPTRHHGLETTAGTAAVQQPRNAHDVPGRTETAFSEANTLVRSNSGRSRNSIAKHPLHDQPSPASASQPLRSIFPTYNPDVSLNEQEYAPTQMGPAHIPRAVISRQSVYEEPESPGIQSAPNRSQPSSPRRPAARGRWPLRIQTQPPPETPTPCTADDLKNLWKVANGWKASASESRVFCLKLSQQKDAPVYTLSSRSSQPFWSLRLDPTSAAAYISLTRHDPAKPLKAPKPDAGNSPGAPGSSGSRSDAKHCYGALSSTLEEESRKHPPNDGLVALLMPTAAARMAVEKADDAASVAAAENECARLVWDEDTATHFLVHNALARPFCVAVERNPAYSRVEYTLEHDESPRHLAKLTRDGTGGGWIELDTGVAAQIDSFYILDVVVAALLLVAAGEDRNSPTPMETFEPPPLPPPAAALGARRSSGRLSKLSIRRDERKNKGKMEAFEIDVESQNDSLGKGRHGRRSSGDKPPFLIRVVVKVARGVFKLAIWVLTALFKAVGGVFKCLYSCVGSKY
ncbi:hypothetical protein MAC_04008 [Metarhizium acridum CQMa 102]|uniref:Acetylserotonin methytransferase-like protein n=1 Tax=Metarhizium acridum (strain CQMa 102) TaxID=655827 RepID=E9E2B0_METAQ|nr:uncharacterized protein MAC_04008 [Metarhizium acridum CQMa 102]EFY90026.1 hypothetical protein MAC_04008 [Metarhizium acridum CQMa 102]